MRKTFFEMLPQPDFTFAKARNPRGFRVSSAEYRALKEDMQQVLEAGGQFVKATAKSDED